MTTALRPFRPIRPGEILQEELEARGWTQADLAQILGRPVQAVNEIIAGKKAVTAKTAVGLARALGTSPEYWLNLESSYRLDLEHQGGGGGGAIERRARLYTLAPIKELLKRGWIQVPDPRDDEKLEREVCRFLSLSSPQDAPKIMFAARKAFADETHTPSQRAWVCRVRRLATEQKVSSYSRSRLVSAVPELVKSSKMERGQLGIEKLLGGLGVRFVRVEHLPGTRIDGATLWLDKRSPVVAVSLRYGRVDCFWFTLMHELAHVLHGDGRETAMLDNLMVGQDNEKPDSDVERRADKQAGEWLLPEEKLMDFVDRTHPYYSREAVITFASWLGVHPAIVVGRLQHTGKIPWQNLRNLLGDIRPQIMRTN